MMMPQNSTTITEAAFFSNVYNQDWYLGLAVAFGCCNLFALTPFLYLIIWYEQYGSDHPRSLINQLVVSTCWNGIVNNIVIIPLQIYLSLFGPLSEYFCLCQFVLRTSIIVNLHLMITFIIYAKYISIFVLRNPTEILSDFWCLFLNLFAFLFALLSQITLVIIPGKKPNNFHICMGTDPRIDDKYPTKFGAVLRGICVLLNFSYMLLCLKVKLWSLHTKHIPPRKSKEFGRQLLPIKDMLEQNSTASLGTIGFFILVLLPEWLGHLALLKLSPEKLSSHPYQIIYFFHELGHRFLFNLFVILLFMSRSHIRRAVLRELFDQFFRLIELFNLHE